MMGLNGPGNAALFSYDALGRRSGKIINGLRVQYVYDGFNPVQETSGANSLANTLTGLRIDEYLTRSDLTGARFFLSDGLGSTMALTDSTGAVQTGYSYEPFGKTSLSGTPSSNPFQYTGRENDGTGLYYYRARYYHPGLQRFIGEDPFPGFQLMPESLNRYPYALNNPQSLVDPDGEFPGLPGLIGGAIGGAIGGGILGAYDGGVTGAIEGAVIGSLVGAAVGLFTDPITGSQVGTVAGGIIEGIIGDLLNPKPLGHPNQATEDYYRRPTRPYNPYECSTCFRFDPNFPTSPRYTRPRSAHGGETKSKSSQ